MAASGEGGARVEGTAGQAAAETVPGSSRPARSRRVGRAMQAPRGDVDDGTGWRRYRPSGTATSIIHRHAKTRCYRLALLEIGRATGARVDRRHRLMAHL